MLGQYLVDVVRRQRRQLPHLRARRDRVQPAGRGVRGHRQGLRRRDPGRPTSTSRARGRVVEMLSEHTCQGWLEGYLLTGRHGLFSCYEAFIHLVDSMVNQHAKWLKTTREHRVAPADRLAQLPAHLARVAPGPQRLLPPGPRLHRPRREQEGRGGPGLPAAGHQHPAVDHAALPGQRALRERRGRRQAAVVRLAGRGGGRPALRPRARASGTGPPTTATTPTSCSACAGDVPTLEALAAVSLLREHLPDLRVRFVNVVDLMRLQDDTRAPARALATATSTPCSPPTGRWSSPTTATRG